VTGRWTAQFSYVSGVVRLADLAYAALVSDVLEADMSETFVPLEWDAGTWRYDERGMTKNWSCVSVAISESPVEQCIYLGAWGEVLLIGSGDTHEEVCSDGANTPREFGPLRAVRSIDQFTYAVGMGRQAYCRTDINRWISIDGGTRTKFDGGDLVGFDAVDGFNSNEIYAAGRRGEIWLYDGRLWSRLDSPTNANLTNMRCCADGNVYVCGQRGTLLVGRDDDWRAIEDLGLDEDIWGIEWYKNKLYVSTRQDVYRLEENGLVSVNFGSDKPKTCYHLSARDNVMWSFGAKDVMSFDGHLWTRVD